MSDFQQANRFMQGLDRGFRREATAEEIEAFFRFGMTLVQRYYQQGGRPLDVPVPLARLPMHPKPPQARRRKAKVMMRTERDQPTKWRVLRDRCRRVPREPMDLTRVCGCGVKYNRVDRGHHEKTKHHQEWLWGKEGRKPSPILRRF